jgi:O-antigen ligase
MARRGISAVRVLRRRQLFSTTAVVAAAVAISAAAGIEMVRLGTAQRELKAVLIIVAAIALGTAALRPRMGLAMLLILVPFEYHFSGTGTDEVLLVAMALVLAWRIRWRTIPVWAAIGAGALVLGSLAAVIGAAEPTIALWGAVRWLAAAIVMFVAFSVLRSRADASRRMADIFTGSAIVVVFFAFAQKAGVYVLVGAPFTAGLPDSFFSYYTNYAGYAAIAGIVASGELLAAITARQRRRCVLYGAALLFILAGLAISASRGGLLALGAGWLVLLVLNLRRGRLVLQAAAVLLILGGVSYFATPSSTISRIEQRFSSPLGKLSEDKERFAVQEAGERALSSKPFGIGYGNFTLYVRSHKNSSVIHEKFTHAQNTPIQMGLDAGWLGLAGFMLLFIVPIVLTFMRPIRGPGTVRASGFAAALCGFMAQGLFDYLFFEVAFVVFYVALVWGTAHALGADGGEVHAREAGFRKLRPLALSASGAGPGA